MAIEEIKGALIEAAVAPLAPIIKAALPDPPPAPGDPHGLEWAMEETSRLQGRGDGSERPENEGDLTPDHGDRKDIAPIVVGTSHDEGGAPAEEVAEFTREAQNRAQAPSAPLKGYLGEVAEWRGLENPELSLQARMQAMEDRKSRRKKKP